METANENEPLNEAMKIRDAKQLALTPLGGVPEQTTAPPNQDSPSSSDIGNLAAITQGPKFGGDRYSAETLRELLGYDPETGSLLWKPRPRRYFKTDAAWKGWNSRYAEKPAGSKNSSGYIQLWLPGCRPLAHVVIWVIQTGEWPERQVDHANHKRDDNRWPNLRATTPAENMKNLGRRANRRSGVAGVYYDKSLKKWRAWISEEGRNRYLGSFDTEEKAIRERKAHEAALGYHPNHGTDTANGEEPLFKERTEIWFD